MEIKELLSLCKGKKKLTNTIKLIYADCMINDIPFDISDMTDVLFDIETKDEFGEDVFTYFEEDFFDKEENEDGWVDSDGIKDFAKLFKGYNWKNITLNNGNILYIIDNGDAIECMIVDYKNIQDGAIEMRSAMRSMNPPLFYEIDITKLPEKKGVVETV